MPEVVNAADDAAFRVQATAMGYDPDDKWVGGYVPVAWQEVRHLVAAYAGDVHDAALLEFGCNYAASSIVAATMGACVTGVDVDADTITLARRNAARHGVAGRIDLRHVRDTRVLPFADASFDIILCISVLEYVAPDQLDAVMGELKRVLKSGGLIIVSGTASRLAPREVHSGRWLVNYWPRVIDRRLFGRKTPLQRGANPFAILRAFGNYENLDLADRGERWLAARAAMGQSPAKLCMARIIARLIRPFGWSIGMTGPSFSATWRKP
ncbi:SAM-dependent methyltransferase [Sphingopyxis panaciterrae]|uniref:class I SAM-dependent methyltransferase n=1 Tax=Sphingopyxis panaciterrae TaxID=363841 RepID=UPI001422945B|nr:class I SAM-dependent methyltransferase [Sphingopyxis panaciterrae]NIJ36709.1 SAM-dependent methyltransferase [Sphingopyxis panaciterrae]